MENSKQNVEQDQKDDQIINQNNEDQKQEQKNNDQSHQNQNNENSNKQEKPPFSIMTLQQLVEKPRKIRQHKKITIDLTKCQYEILREVAQLFNWNIIDNSENYENEVKSDFNIKWYDSYIQEDQLRALLPYQKINRFPGSNNLGRKNLLAKYLIKLQKVHPEDYSFFPRTWLLPNQLEELRSFTQKCNFSKYLIVKPENQSQGKGIYLTKKIDKNLDSQDHFVIQEYITNPYLIDNLKFDLRIYVLLKSVCPLKIFIYKEGLVRFATQEYAKPNKQNQQNLMMHLTNYAINKKSDKFQFNTNQDDDNKGHKRSLSSFLIELQQKGINVENLWDQIKQVVVKTFCSCIPNIQHIYKSCQPKEENNEISFELFGFDIFLDEKLKPYLLEVNHTPSFSTDTPLDHQIKKSLILDTLILENIMWKTRVRYFDQKNNVNPSIKGGSNNRMSKEDIQIQKEKRITWEQNNVGGYEQIYPELYDEELQKQYDKFKQSAQDQFDQFSGANIQRAQKKEYKKELPPIKINGASTNKFAQNQQSNKTTNNNQNAQSRLQKQQLLQQQKQQQQQQQQQQLQQQQQEQLQESQFQQQNSINQIKDNGRQENNIQISDGLSSNTSYKQDKQQQRQLYQNNMKANYDIMPPTIGNQNILKNKLHMQQSYEQQKKNNTNVLNTIQSNRDNIQAQSRSVSEIQNLSPQNSRDSYRKQQILNQLRFNTIENIEKQKTQYNYIKEENQIKEHYKNIQENTSEQKSRFMHKNQKQSQSQSNFFQQSQKEFQDEFNQKNQANNIKIKKFMHKNGSRQADNIQNNTVKIMQNKIEIQQQQFQFQSQPNNNNSVVKSFQYQYQNQNQNQNSAQDKYFAQLASNYLKNGNQNHINNKANYQQNHGNYNTNKQINQRYSAIRSTSLQKKQDDSQIQSQRAKQPFNYKDFQYLCNQNQKYQQQKQIIGIDNTDQLQLLVQQMNESQKSVLQKNYNQEQNDTSNEQQQQLFRIVKFQKNQQNNSENPNQNILNDFSQSFPIKDQPLKQFVIQQQQRLLQPQSEQNNQAQNNDQSVFYDMTQKKQNYQNSQQYIKLKQNLINKQLQEQQKLLQLQKQNQAKDKSPQGNTININNLQNYQVFYNNKKLNYAQENNELQQLKKQANQNKDILNNNYKLFTGAKKFYDSKNSSNKLEQEQYRGSQNQNNMINYNQVISSIERNKNYVQNIKQQQQQQQQQKIIEQQLQPNIKSVPIKYFNFSHNIINLD